MGVIATTAILFGLGVVQIYFSLTRGEEISCNYLDPFGLRDWLSVNGLAEVIVGMLAGGNLIYSYCAKEKVPAVLLKIFYAAKVLQFLWLGLGAWIFWGNCIDSKPAAINTLMYFVLVIGFVNSIIEFVFRKL